MLAKSHILSAVIKIWILVHEPSEIEGDGAVGTKVEIVYLLFISPVLTALYTISKYEATCIRCVSYPVSLSCQLSIF